MKVYDCFTFYNEFELLELRLKSLWDVVDYFVIAEADKKHTNEPKPYYFWERQDEFKEFWPKIRHLPVEMNVPYKGVGDWSIENAQRNALIYGLEDAEPDDLIMISDLDEIPSPDVFRRLKENTILLTVPYFVPENQKKIGFLIPSGISANYYLEYGAIALEQNLYYYYFDLMNPNISADTVLTKRKNLTTPQEMRNLRNKFLRVPEGGWHFSYMGGIDRVIDKMTSIVDGNAIVVHSGGKLIDRKHVEEALAKGTDIYNRPDTPEAQFYPYDARNICLPYLDEFLRKYPHFLREPEKYFGGFYDRK